MAHVGRTRSVARQADSPGLPERPSLRRGRGPLAQPRRVRAGGDRHLVLRQPTEPRAPRTRGGAMSRTPVSERSVLALFVGLTANLAVVVLFDAPWWVPFVAQLGSYPVTHTAAHLLWGTENYGSDW